MLECVMYVHLGYSIPGMPSYFLRVIVLSQSDLSYIVSIGGSLERAHGGQVLVHSSP